MQDSQRSLPAPASWKLLRTIADSSAVASAKADLAESSDIKTEHVAGLSDDSWAEAVAKAQALAKSEGDSVPKSGD